VTAELTAGGWQVVRIWEFELYADLSACADRVERAVRREAHAATSGPAA
jgi:very-short-patch-repair endonuclease